MECFPTDNAEVVNVPWPLLSVIVLRVEEPSLRVTVPLGVPPLDETVVVKVTDAPNVEGLKDDATDVVVATATIANDALTDWVAFMVTEQLPAPLHAPPQPVKLEVGDAVGVRFTTVPPPNLAVQVAGQLMPDGLVVTVPVPVPPSVTVRE
jgi:hypothetical protein